MIAPEKNSILGPMFFAGDGDDRTWATKTRQNGA